MIKPLVVITGANSGVGLACAKLYTSLGHPALLLDLNVDNVSALKLNNAVCEHVDVTDPDSFSSAIAKAERQYGPADCLINNAGTMFLGDIGSQPSKHWHTMFAVNVDGVINGVQACLESMRQQGRGTIINMGSLGAIKPLEHHGIYNATKAAVHSLSEMLRQEVAQSNIRVCVLAPGAIDTNLINTTKNPEIVAGHKNYVYSIGGALSANDIATLLLTIYQMPQHICIRELVVGATQQVV
ncbi:SDR family oxidoreductase [Vibrio sp. SCSIO 43140]|uniref:SDR family oxidoreductase n=1 Tax=Vibrio sp. SCSIO 43140 TaxID=2819100 RepID=UPI00207522E3|nr:SDR family oxidoreductase [Vibrio sp. SCSIO 43140]USD59690.1 SDR family oxidoreductase [Vibrio sp. SCSIO 43140]